MLDIDVRIKNKRDTASNWELENPIPLNGEIIIVDDENVSKLKIGDGVTNYNNLPFIDKSIYELIDEVSDMYSAHISTEANASNLGHVTLSDTHLRGDISHNSGIAATPKAVNTVYKFAYDLTRNVVNATSSTLNVSTSSCFTKTITGNTAFIFSGLSEGESSCFTLILTNGGNHLVYYTNDVRWTNGEVPQLTENGVDVLTFITMDGGITWYGTPSILNAQASAT